MVNELAQRAKAGERQAFCLDLSVGGHKGASKSQLRSLLQPQPSMADGSQFARQRQFAERHGVRRQRSEEHTSELQSLMRISYDVFCLKKKNRNTINITYIAIISC